VITSEESTGILVNTLKKIVTFKDHAQEIAVIFAVQEHIDAMYQEFHRREIETACGATSLIDQD
jgi:hypothetical protein